MAASEEDIQYQVQVLDQEVIGMNEFSWTEKTKAQLQGNGNSSRDMQSYLFSNYITLVLKVWMQIHQIHTPTDSDGNKTRFRAQPGDVIPMFEQGFHVNLPP